MSTIFNHANNPLLSKSFNFAVNIVKFCQLLTSERNFIIANQLLRSGTSIGANIRDAQAAESRPDFIHKLKISAKEIEETIYWLQLIKESAIIEVDEIIFLDLLEVKKMVSKSISTAKQNHIN